MIPTPTPTAVSGAEAFATWSDTASNVAQVLAIVIGGIWTYMLFVKRREKWPRASLEHHIQHWTLEDGRRVLRVVEKVTNTGGVLLQLARRRTWVQQILPILDAPLADLVSGTRQEARWLTLGHTHETTQEPHPPELEPGEHDHFEHDFLIDSDAEVVQVYSHFRNANRRKRWWHRRGKPEDERGWTLTTVHDLTMRNQTDNKMEDLAKEA